MHKNPYGVFFQEDTDQSDVGILIAYNPIVVCTIFVTLF